MKHTCVGEGEQPPSNCQELDEHQQPYNFQYDSASYSSDSNESFEMIHDARVDDEETFKKKLKHYRQRWCALSLMVFVIFGSYFCYDNPSELQVRIQEKFGVSQTQYSLLYSSYSLPNMIVPVCGGLILSKIGKGWGLFMFSSIITIGQIICAFGGWFDSFTMLVFGRGIHGLGGESQQMVQAVYVASWFYDQEISLAMGICQLMLLVSFLGGWLIPRIAMAYGIGNAFAAGAFSCIFSMIMACSLIWMDIKARKDDKKMIAKRRESI